MLQPEYTSSTSKYLTSFKGLKISKRRVFFAFFGEESQELLKNNTFVNWRLGFTLRFFQLAFVLMSRLRLVTPIQKTSPLFSNGPCANVSGYFFETTVALRRRHLSFSDEVVTRLLSLASAANHCLITWLKIWYHSLL